MNATTFQAWLGTLFFAAGVALLWSNHLAVRLITGILMIAIGITGWYHAWELGKDQRGRSG